MIALALLIGGSLGLICGLFLGYILGLAYTAAGYAKAMLTIKINGEPIDPDLIVSALRRYSRGRR